MGDEERNRVLIGQLVNFGWLKLRIKVRNDEGGRLAGFEIGGSGDTFLDKPQDMIAVFVGEEIAASRNVAWAQSGEFRVFRVKKNDGVIEAD